MKREFLHARQGNEIVAGFGPVLIIFTVGDIHEVELSKPATVLQEFDKLLAIELNIPGGRMSG